MVAGSSGSPTPVLPDQRDGGLDEAVVDRPGHVDALDAAAALPRVVEGAVDHVLHREVEVGVLADVGGILAAELESCVDEAVRDLGVDLAAARDRAGERDVVHAPGADQLRRRAVIERDRRDEAVRHIGARERVGEVAAAERREPGVLDQHGIAGEERRDDHVDGDEERVVPRGDVERDAQRLVADEALEAVLRRERLVGERRLRQPAHGLRAIDHRADLVLGLLERLAHLAGDVEGDLVGHRPERGDHLAHGAHALGHRHAAPVALRRACPGDDGGELRGRRVGDLAERRLRGGLTRV